MQKPMLHISATIQQSYGKKFQWHNGKIVAAGQSFLVDNRLNYYT